MAKKNINNEKEVIEEKETQETNTSNEKEKPKPSRKVEDKKEKTIVKRTLLDLIDEMEDTSLIFEKLMRHGYYKQYKQERKLKEQGYNITPSITKEEFEKITK